MLLTEIFDKQFDIDWVNHPGSSGGTALIKINDIEIEVGFDFVYRDIDTEILSIYFYVTNEYHDFTVNLLNRNKYQFLIFSAVYQVVKEYLTDYGEEIDLITFSAAKDENQKNNRNKLYDLFIKRYASKLGYELMEKNLINYPKVSEYEYILKRKK